MTNTGINLEDFVQEIEKLFLPKNFEVNARERIFNESGIQEAEFDIVINGNLGSTNIKWLIECRDRSSQGPAPSDWIEQLVGRRDRFNFNKVTAVSTTGFSPSAIKYAEEKGIELRVVKNLLPDSIKGWFKAETIILTLYESKLIYANIEVDPDISNEVKDALVAKLQKVVSQVPLAEAPILIQTENKREFTILNAWKEFLDTNRQLYEELTAGGETKPVKVKANYRNPNSRYMIEVNGEFIHIFQIAFIGELFITQRQIPIQTVRKYEKILSNEVVAETVNFEVDTGNEIIALNFHRIGSSGDIYVSGRKKPSDA